jgi:predicted amidophosphoribosyltransferase
MQLWDALVEAAFPTWCPGCGCRGNPVCTSCAATLRPAAPMPPPLGIDRWLAPFRYEGVARELIARMKYRHERAAAPWLAARMAVAVTAARLPAEPEVVTFAPTTAARRRARGFDHAEILAASVASQLGLPVRAMLRRPPGPPQTGQPASQRRVGPRFESHADRVARVVLLVDDVATTGATLAAAAEALRANGAATVLAVTGARTPPPRATINAGAYTRSMAAGSRR